MDRRTVLALTFLAACTPDPAPPDRFRRDPTEPTGPAPPVETLPDTGSAEVACPAPSVEPGVGASDFAPVVDGCTVGLVHGGQGGWHVEAAGFVTGTAQEVAVSTWLLSTTTGARIGGSDPSFLALAAYDAERCEGTFAGARAVLDLALVPADTSAFDWMCSLEGEELELGLRVEDLVSGSAARSRVRVVVELDPYDIASCR